MPRIYLIVKDSRAAVVVLEHPGELSADLWGGGYDMHEIGLAHPETPPGMILGGEAGVEITLCRPIGKPVRRIVDSPSAKSKTKPRPSGVEWTHVIVPDDEIDENSRGDCI